MCSITINSVLQINILPPLNVSKVLLINSLSWFWHLLHLELLRNFQIISFGFAHAFFPEKISILKMGLFTLGCSPGGGASNMWTFLLGGNLNLSITMTFFSTIAALGMMPLWLFTLGKIIFDENDIAIPFTNIITILIALIVPVVIGVLIKRFWPRIASVLKKLLAPFCILLIIYIVCFGVYVNLYMFKFFTWQVSLGSLCTIWSGFAIGLIASSVLKFSKENIIAVTIETGIQNTGIAFVLLSHSLDAPEGDIAAVVPVAASIMMPIPLITYYVFQKIRDCIKPSSEKCKVKESPSEAGTEYTFVLTPQDCDISRSAT
ncbi:Ileal sodium/bile acid cotransporter [Nymphon striatum]|nr:Ileal sodium/bile acid cotransporter [Nymphon striatum]